MYIVLETQTNTDGTVGTLTSSYESENEAKSKYHTVLAAAAISSLPKHTAFLVRDDGYLVESECFRHDIESEEQ